MKEIELPNIDDMYTTIEKIREYQFQSLILKAEIEELESSTLEKVTTDSEYFVNNKPPSVAYATTAYLTTGLNGEIMEKRKAYADVLSNLEFQRLRFDLDKLVIDIWRTQSANLRRAVE